MGVRVASSIVIPQAKTHSYSIGTQEAAALERANAFGKENKHALVHSPHHLYAVPVAESMRSGFFLRKEPLEHLNTLPVSLPSIVHPDCGSVPVLRPTVHSIIPPLFRA
jgi:hypothetical protein